MTKQNQRENDNTRNAKKARVLGQTKKGNRIPIIAAAIVAVAAITAGVLMLGGSGPNAAVPVATGTTQGDRVVHQASAFEDGKAHYFQFVSQNVTIRYFVLKSSDGIIRAAFDACDVCWRANKGYYQDGDDMVCRNCGRRFASVRINEVQGGCNPAPLIRAMDGDQVVIRKADLVQGIGFFTFGKGNA